MGLIQRQSPKKGQSGSFVDTGQNRTFIKTATNAAPGRPFIVLRQARTDNEPATMPHPKNQRPDKGKLTQAKKVIASGMTEAEAIDRAKGGDAEAFEGLYGLHKRR